MPVCLLLAVIAAPALLVLLAVHAIDQGGRVLRGASLSVEDVSVGPLSDLTRRSADCVFGDRESVDRRGQVKVH